MKKCTCGPREACTEPCDRNLKGLDKEVERQRGVIADLMYVGNRLARGEVSPEEWHDAVMRATPDHAKPIVCRSGSDG